MDVNEYHYRCKSCHDSFAAGAIECGKLHLFWGAVTLGVWLVVLAFWCLFHLYWQSQCPTCHKRSKRLLFLILSLVFASAELLWGIYYFTEIAPLRIVQEASMTHMPDHIDIANPVNHSEYIQIFSYLWTVGIMPSVGAYISMYWPYVIVGWFGFMVLLSFYLSSYYRRRT